MNEFTAKTIDEATAVGGEVYHRHDLRVEAAAPFGMRIRAQSWNDIVIGSLEYASPVRISADAFADSYQVNLPVYGAVWMNAAGHEAIATPSRAVVHGPFDPTVVEGWFRPTRLTGVKVPNRLVDAALDRISEGVPLPHRPSVALDVERPPADTWLRLVRRISWWRAGELHDPAIDDSLRDAMVFALALAMRSMTVDDRIGAIGPSFATDAHDGPVTRPRGDLAAIHAMAVMHARADSNLGISDLARAVGIGVRALEKRTVAEYGSTPAQLWRRIRLSYARRELHGLDARHRGTRQGRDGGTTAKIGRIAARWGFGHGGRFAATYEQSFGELPSETLAAASRARHGTRIRDHASRG